MPSGQTSLRLETESSTVSSDDRSKVPHSKSTLFQELDESSQMLDMLTQSLNVMDYKSKPVTPPDSSTHRKPRLSHSVSNASSVFSETEDQENLARVQEAAGNGGVKRRSRTLSENASRHQVVSNLSTSEPDLPNMEDTPPPLPPRTADMLAPSTPSHDSRSQGSLIGGRMVRGSSEHSLLTASVNLGHTYPSPFHHGNAMLVSPAHQTRSALSTPERKKHSNTMEHSGSRTPKRSSKKASTFGRYSPVPDVADGALPPRTPKKDKSKSRWVGLKERMNKTFKRSPSMEPVQGIPREARSQSIPTIRKNHVSSVARKTSVGPEVKLSVAVDMPDGGGPSPSRRQRTLSVQGGGVTLISKIFTVLNCWQENYSEVRQL